MKHSISSIHDQFMEQCRYSARLRPATLRSYDATFKLFISLTPNARIADLTPATMSRFFRTLEERVRIVGRDSTRSGVRSSTIATYRAKLNRFLAWLVSQGHLRVNPLDSVPAPSVEYEDRQYLAREQVEQIFMALAFGIQWDSTLVRKRNVAIFSLLLHCGLRAGELLGLRMLDVDLDRAELTVRAETSKSKRKRRVPLNSAAQRALEDYFSERVHAGRTTPALWTSCDQDREFTRDGLKHLVEHVKRKCGVRFHLHQLRHTFAVNVLCAGSDVAKLKQLLGHRDARMTCAYLRCLPVSTLRPDVERLSIDSLI
jgi:site-specific recombinase XerD